MGAQCEEIVSLLLDRGADPSNVELHSCTFAEVLEAGSPRIWQSFWLRILSVAEILSAAAVKSVYACMYLGDNFSSGLGGCPFVSK